MILRLCLLLIAILPLALAAEPGASPPPSDSPAAPARLGELAQYGITWRFREPALCGRFITGDWWVQGPVEIVAITPPPGQGRHGSVVNPEAKGKQGYDDRGLSGYDASLVPQLPFVLAPDQSLVSTISIETVGKKTPDTVPGQYCLGAIRTAAVLTCVAAPPPANAFRPGYAGTWKRIYTTDDLHPERLPNLAPPAVAPEAVLIAALERQLERPWIDHWAGWTGRYIHPYENMPDYGREITSITSRAALLLTLQDAPTAYRRLFLRYLQLGIDLYGITQANNNLWNADGGHCSGRKVPILFAGVLFDDPDLLRVQASFQEDQQTYYGEGYRGQKALWRITGGDARKHEDLPPAEWAGPRFKGQNNGWKSQGYRTLNGPTWVGQALAIRLLGAKPVWNHDAFFDYVDRWVAEADNGLVGEKMLPKGYDPFGGPSGGFVRAMWSLYRPRADEIAGRFQPALEAALARTRPAPDPPPPLPAAPPATPPATP